MNPKGKFWLLALLAVAVPIVLMTGSCAQSASADELVVTYYYLPG